MSTETLRYSRPPVGQTLRSMVLLPELLTLAAYIVLIAWAIAHHEPWSDEAQSWLIARNVPVVELFTNTLRYEGHPALWYLVIGFLAKLHIDYAGLHWFCGMVGAVSASLLIFLSPLPRIFRLALPFTFFLAFQYVVIARSYVLVPLLLFCVALAWRRSILLVALLLGLLANVSMHSFAISAGFFMLYWVELHRGILTVSRRQIQKAIAISAVLYLVAIGTVYPRPTDALVPFLYEPTRDDMMIFRPFWIIWTLCKSIIQPVFLALPLWILVIRQFNRIGQSFFLLPVATLALACGYFSSFRHAGLVVPTAITLCWIAWPELKSYQGWRPVGICIAICIAVQIAWTIRAIHHHPYAPDLETARFLAPYVKAGDTMAVTYVKRADVNAFHYIGLYPFFDHPIFINERDPYWLWNTRMHTFNQFDRAMKENPDMVVAVFWDTRPFDPAKDLTGPRIERLQKDGFRLTNTFCAAKPEGFEDRENTCFLIYQRGPR